MISHQRSQLHSYIEFLKFQNNMQMHHQLWSHVKLRIKQTDNKWGKRSWICTPIYVHRRRISSHPNFTSIQHFLIVLKLLQQSMMILFIINYVKIPISNYCLSWIKGYIHIEITWQQKAYHVLNLNTIRINYTRYPITNCRWLNYKRTKYLLPEATFGFAGTFE